MAFFHPRGLKRKILENRKSKITLQHFIKKQMGYTFPYSIKIKKISIKDSIPTNMTIQKTER